MSTEELLVSAIVDAATDAGERVYPAGDADMPATPYVAYTVAAGANENVFVGASPVDNVQVQIDCFATTYAGAKALADQVAAAVLAASDPTAFKPILIRGPFDAPYEDIVKLHRRVVEFSIWNR